MVKNKIKIAVSSCLLGEAVRYDGTDKHITYITQELAKEYTLISLCPEMAVGMGVPREPIHLVDQQEEIQVVGVDNPSMNMSEPLINYGLSVSRTQTDICGYIFKKNSPSCGTKNVKVLNIHGEYEKKGKGIYAATIMNALPKLPVIDEQECLDENIMARFLFDVAQYANNIK